MLLIKQLLLVIFLGILSALFSETLVDLHGFAETDQSEIRLGDIAEISGEYASLLDTLVVGHSTAPGYNRFILRDEIFLFSQLPSEVKNSVVLSGVTRCSVKSVGQDITVGDIIDQVREELETELIWDKASWTLDLGSSDSVITTLWNSEYNVSLGRVRSNTLKGDVVIPVIISQNNRSGNRINIHGRIEVVTEVAVAKREIRSGETVQRSDFTTEIKNISDLPFDPAQFRSGVSYSIRSGIVRAGSVITVNRVRENQMIERGHPVTIVSTVGSASVQVRGTARQSGSIGDVISVENSVSRKMIQGTVVRPGVVQVHRGGNV